MQIVRPIALSAAFCALSTNASATDLSLWLSPVSGSWADPANWAGGDLPDLSNECAVFGLAGPYTVTASTNETHGGYRLQNPDVTLRIDFANHTVFGDVLNQGLIVIDGSAINFGTGDRLIDGSGVITLGDSGSTGFIDSEDATVTHGADHRIDGNGVLQAFLGGPWINHGTIVANDAGGSGIEFDAPLTQVGDGRIGANAGTLLLQNGSSITGGLLFNVNGGKVKVDGPLILSGIRCTLNDVRVEGRIDIEDDSKILVIDGPIVNNGQIVVNGNLDANGAEIEITADAAISGTGEIVLNTSFSNVGLLTLDSFLNVTIGPDMTIRGAGRIESSSSGLLINDGAIIADDPNEPLVLTRDFTGSGLFGANNAELIIGEFADLIGCTLNSNGTGKVVVSENFITLDGGRNEGDLELMEEAQLFIEGTYINNGSITHPNAGIFSDSITLRNGATLAGNGSVFIDTFQRIGLDTSGGTATIGANQTLMGEFWMDGDFDVNGTIEPEGVIEMEGDVLLGPTAVLRMDLLESTGRDDEIRLRSRSGALTLGGTLELELEGGFVPFDGQLWFPIDGVPDIDLVGFFDNVVVTNAPPGFEFLAEIVPAGLRITAVETCPPDLAPPFGVLNFFDISTFISLYNAGDPTADFADPIGTLNFFDISAFIAAYNAGCP